MITKPLRVRAISVRADGSDAMLGCSDGRAHFMYVRGRSGETNEQIGTVETGRTPHSAPISPGLPPFVTPLYINLTPPRVEALGQTDTACSNVLGPPMWGWISVHSPAGRVEYCPQAMCPVNLP